MLVSIHTDKNNQTSKPTPFITFRKFVQRLSQEHYAPGIAVSSYRKSGAMENICEDAGCDYQCIVR